MRRSHKSLPTIFLGLASTVSLATFSAEAHAADRKFALAMMHFNVQYVAGGMMGFWPNYDARLDLDAEAIEDQIVAESFAPVLDLFEKHPTWSTDVELQGYMLDVMAARHPAVLAKLKTLATARRVQVVSFHYSDQLFIAHAPEDWERSAALNRATFDKHGIPLGTSVFCQEGQSSIGMAAAMKKHGYRTMVWPKNLFNYQHPETLDSSPLYRFGDVSMVTTRGGKFDVGAGNTVEIEWTFVDDGELLATGSATPYTPDVFHAKPSAIAAYEAKLQNLESRGFEIVTVEKFAEAVRPIVTPAAPPPLLDGTWQPKVTDGVQKWMGGGGFRVVDERDNDVRTLASIAHRELMAATTIAEKAGLDAKPEIDSAFRLLVLGEVSDASGINPFRGEAEYGIAHMTESLRIARDVIVRAKAKLAMSSVAIDTAARTVAQGAARPATGSPIEAPLVLVIDAGDRPKTARWVRIGKSWTVLTLDFAPGTTQRIAVTFPGPSGMDLMFTPALMDTPMRFRRDDFTFDHYMLALHDGLIGLAPNLWVLKDLAAVHVAARVTRTSGDISFEDETTTPDESIRWVFHLIDGDDVAATASARGLNVLPTVWR